MHILGFQKMTLLDYPEKIAATIFLGGCNFRCPFCHNATLVVNPTEQSVLSLDEIKQYLIKRQGILDGICITGGEPTLNYALPQLLSFIKELNFLTKLDTNGSNPDLILDLIKHNLVDYIAMDLKNSKENYNLTCGSNVDIEAIDRSVQLLKQNLVPYEFRTTVVRELHSLEDFKSIGQWLSGAKRYYLQNFKESGNLICPNTFHSYSKDELLQIKSILKPYLTSVNLRGVD